MFVRVVNSCLIINMKQISLFYAENVLKMWKMRKSANYADPHHRILSDALLYAKININLLLTKREGSTGKYWPEVIFIWTLPAALGQYKNNRGPIFPRIA